MRESIIQTAINKFLTWLAKKSVTALYKRTHFWTFSWGLDENTDLYLMSEESYHDYHRFGVSEEKRADTPQTDCNTNQCVQRVEYVGNDEKSRCWTCKHFERMHETPISSDGSYYIYVVCTAKECNYEPKGEPQTDCGWK